LAGTSGTSNHFYGVYFANANTGYAVGGNGKIIKTPNAGSSWTAQVSGSSRSLFSVYFTDANTGYVVGDSGTILKTTNGGGSWIEDKQPNAMFKIYPNPASERITLIIDNKNNKNLTLNIYTITGVLLNSEIIEQKNLQINTEDLCNGVYLIELKSATERAIQKLIIQR